MAKKGFITVSPFKVTVDRKQLMKELTVLNQRKMAAKLRAAIDPELQKKQKELVAEFKAHPITIEIDAGPSASNLSGTLGGYGNLFSFIGFSSGDNPTELIKRVFNEKMKFKVKRVNEKGKYRITFFIPSVEEIYGLTPLSWSAGQSWVEGIERGMSNLGSYLYSESGFSSSVSGTGIQTKNRASGVRFTNTPYVSKLLKDFKKKLSKFK